MEKPKEKFKEKRKVILFDLGGVLIENTGRAALTALLPDSFASAEIWHRWLASPVVRQFERGQISAEAFAAGFIKEWNIGLAPTDFIGEFAAWPKGLYEGAEALLRALKTRHHLACLSNTNTIHWGRLGHIHELFDSCFLSHEMGHVKPDPEAFQHALDKLGVDPQDIYFFDDLAPNVEAARKAGMRAFQVEDFSGIEPILRTEGLYQTE